MELTPDFYVNLKNGRFDSTTAQQMDAIFARWDAEHAAGNRRSLVVHFHGGLVSEQSGMNTARRLVQFYWDSGAYPVFFVWEAGLFEVLLHNLQEIFDERFFKRVLSIASKFVIGKLNDGAARGPMLALPSEAEIQTELRLGIPGEVPFDDRSAGELPADAELSSAQEQQLRQMIETDMALAAEVQAIMNSRRAAADTAVETGLTRGGTVRTVSHSLMDPAVIQDIQAERDAGDARAIYGMPGRVVKGAVVIVARVIQRFAKRRDHGVYATIVEEILREFYVGNAGQFVWEQMKKDTKDAFQAGPEQFGGTRFLQLLNERLRVDPQRSVTLVGHSTGAVYILNLLKEAAGALPPSVQFDVVFLAPANTFDLMKEALDVATSRIRNLRVFGMQDAVERADRLVPVVYPHSLLYFVSGVCEKGEDDSKADTPIMGMERFYTKDVYEHEPAVAAVKPFLATGGRQWSVWSICDNGVGFASDAIKHGDFDNYETDATPKAIRATGTSVRHILQNGYV